MPAYRAGTYKDLGPAGMSGDDYRRERLSVWLPLAAAVKQQRFGMREPSGRWVDRLTDPSNPLPHSRVFENRIDSDRQIPYETGRFYSAVFQNENHLSKRIARHLIDYTAAAGHVGSREWVSGPVKLELRILLPVTAKVSKRYVLAREITRSGVPITGWLPVLNARRRPAARVTYLPKIDYVDRGNMTEASDENWGIWLVEVKNGVPALRDVMLLIEYT